MSIPRYGVYKDSGLDWLGQVPAHWTIKRLRFVVELNPSKAELASIDRATEVSFLPMEAIGDDGSIRLERIRTIADVETGYTYFRDGDVTLAKITPCFENGKGALMEGLTAGIGFGTTELIVARPKASQILGALLNWIFRSPNFRAQGEASMYGAGGQKRVPDDFVRNLEWALPPLDEQTTIAAFLDRETAKIDALIAEQEKLIILLAEKRQATISHAVTKGLNPSAPMRDAGVEWLSQMPAHWSITRLKFVASVQTGIAKGKDTNGKQTITVPYLRVANVQDGFLALNDVATIEIEAEQLERYRLLPGDVLMNEGGDFDKLGRGAIWQGEIADCIHQNHVFAVRPHGISSEWLNRVTSSQYAQFYFMGRSKQSTNLASISSTNIMELPILLPPPREQEAILQFIGSEITRLDSLKDQSRQAIRLLVERRSALIAAAVTGQIDVRGTMSQADAQTLEPIAA
jgi:type I restriction enzyme S subunit